MLVYILNFIIIVFYMILFIKVKNEKTKKILFFLTVLQLILIQGCRDLNLGSDMPFYWKYYNEQLYYSYSNLDFSRYELFFKLLTKFITSITLNRHFYLIIISTISTFPIGYVVYKYSKNPFLSILLYLAFGFYNFNFSGLRQAMAFGIIFFSYIFIVDRKLIKFLLTILCASLFHSSAIVFVPAYFLYNFKVTKIKIFIALFLDLFIYIFKGKIFNILNSIFYEEYSMVVTDSYLWMIMCLFIVILCALFYKRIVKSNKANNALFYIVMFGSTIMLLSPVANNILRIANYYYMFVILLIPEVIDCIKKLKDKFYINTIIIIFSFLLYLYLLNVDSYNIVTYVWGGFL